MIDEGISVRDLEMLRDQFASDMRQNGKSESTIRIYTWAINSLGKHVRADSQSIVNRETLDSWQEVLRPLNDRSKALATTGVRLCLKWAAEAGYLRDDRLARQVPNLKFPRLGPPSTLTPSVLLKIEYHLQTEAETHPKSVLPQRDRALFHYVKSTGGLVSEILQVRRDSFERQDVRQRGGESKALTAPPGVARLIREYLRVRTDDNEWLWVAYHTDGHVAALQDAGVLQIWARLAKKVGVPRFTTQELRNTAATLLVERGHDDATIMEFLGNRDRRSLQGYKAVVADKLARLRADLDVGY